MYARAANDVTRGRSPMTAKSVYQKMCHELLPMKAVVGERAACKARLVLDLLLTIQSHTPELLSMFAHVRPYYFLPVTVTS